MQTRRLPRQGPSLHPHLLPAPGGGAASELTAASVGSARGGTRPACRRRRPACCDPPELPPVSPAGPRSPHRLDGDSAGRAHRAAPPRPERTASWGTCLAPVPARWCGASGAAPAGGHPHPGRVNAGGAEPTHPEPGHVGAGTSAGRLGPGRGPAAEVTPSPPPGSRFAEAKALWSR